MSMISVRLDSATMHEFELIAKVKHQTKSELLKELIKEFLNRKRAKMYKQALENIANHEKEHPEEYADIYELRQDW